jgi:hypothetical protein
METEPAITSSGMQLPGYLKPFAKRPGAWGVFHLVGVEVGLRHRSSTSWGRQQATAL